jgi:predicted transposase YdaD
LNGYDATLKLLFQRSGASALRQLTGVAVERWLNVELPRVQNPRVDLLGETSEGELVHVEFQSRNDPAMEHRMAEYYLAIYRRLNRYPRQTLIFVGDEGLRMKDRLDSPAMSYQYHLIDIRAADGGVLINSARVEDNILSVLTRLPDQEGAIRRVLEKIAECEEGERETALQQFLVVAGLRHLEEMIEQEVKKVPVLNDILENKVLGREYKRGVKEGELTLLRRQIQGRFGSLPDWAEVRLSKSSPAEIEVFGLRLLDSDVSLEEVLK